LEKQKTTFTVRRGKIRTWYIRSIDSEFEKRMTILQIRDLGNEDKKPQRSQDFKMMIDIEPKLSFPLVITGAQDVIYLNRPAGIVELF
jgi:hypothetical protein